MIGISQLTVIGQLARQPELKFSSSGLPFVRLTVPVRNPLNKDETIWYDATLWRENAEKTFPLLYKGQDVVITGDAGYGSYTKADGTVVQTRTVEHAKLGIRSFQAREASGEAAMATPAVFPDEEEPMPKAMASTPRPPLGDLFN